MDGNVNPSYLINGFESFGNLVSFKNCDLQLSNAIYTVISPMDFLLDGCKVDLSRLYYVNSGEVSTSCNLYVNGPSNHTISKLSILTSLGNSHFFNHSLPSFAIFVT